MAMVVDGDGVIVVRSCILISIPLCERSFHKSVHKSFNMSDRVQRDDEDEHEDDDDDNNNNNIGDDDDDGGDDRQRQSP